MHRKTDIPLDRWMREVPMPDRGSERGVREHPEEQRPGRFSPTAGQDARPGRGMRGVDKPQATAGGER